MDRNQAIPSEGIGSKLKAGLKNADRKGFTSVGNSLMSAWLIVVRQVVDCLLIAKTFCLVAVPVVANMCTTT